MCSRICKHNYRITIIVKIGYHDHSPAGLVVTGVPLARGDMHSPRVTGRPLSIHPVVPHAGLLGKLEHYGIYSKILLWIINFLNNRKQGVVLVVDGSFSNFAEIDSGIPQGTVLGPLLFLLHINDLPSCINSKVRLFADDCLLYREIKNNQDQIDMQRNLDALMDCGSTWGMKFDTKKCNIMRVSRSRKPLQHFYSLGSEILQEVSDAKYLVIQIDNKLDWNKHILTVAARDQSKLAFLNRNLKGCPKKLRDTAYIFHSLGLH